MSKQKIALISGISGQDGSHLTDFLLEKNYKVYCLIRRTSSDSTWRIKHILDKITLIEGDLIDQNSVNRAIQEACPDEIYNLAAQSMVPVSWKEPELTAQITGLGTLRILEAIRHQKSDTKFYQAGSSEMFGSSPPLQSEVTPFHPRSPYAVAKVFSHYLTINYSESFGIFGANGILFNHTGTRRGPEFVTKKITNAVARIYYKKQNKLMLGDLSTKRDFGYAPDFCEYMWKMLQKDKPDTYVIGTGETHSIQEFCDLAFQEVGLNSKDYVEFDLNFLRPAEVYVLQADNTKAKKELGFEVKTSFNKLVSIMVQADLEREK
jgi:GDPmannose 4,6-dehydratase